MYALRIIGKTFTRRNGQNYKLVSKIFGKKVEDLDDFQP